MILDRDPHRLFGVPRTHALEPAGRAERVRGGTRIEVRWFLEHDADGTALARYRCCDERRASGERRLSWERYALDGTLLARELRRAVRPGDAAAVH